jgi:hypothetical protein
LPNYVNQFNGELWEVMGTEFDDFWENEVTDWVDDFLW